MTTDATEESDESSSVLYLNTQVGAEYDASSDTIVDTVQRIGQLMLYIKGTWYTDSQRRRAEAEIFRLKMGLVSSFDHYCGSIDMLIDMSQPPVRVVKT